YQIVDKVIVIKLAKAEKKEKTVTQSVEEQVLSVSGRVTDKGGNPLPGVNVIIQATMKGTTTDADGKYLIETPPNTTLIFSFVGFTRKEIAVNNRKEINVSLLEEIAELKEVTVNAGYYTVKEKERTGSISKVNAAEIEKQPVQNVLSALQANVAGLDITQQTGVPGGSFKVLIRGQNSIASGNDPLYIIDGVPFSSTSLSPVNNSSFPLFLKGTSPLNSIDPANIESIEILKDADATAIYGSRGANGVILITTKKGRAGKTKVDLNFYSGIGNLTRYMDLLNSEQYMEMRNEAFTNDGKTPGSSDYDLNGLWDNTRYTDWQKVLLGNTAKSNDIQLSVSGGSDLTQFSVGGGYHRETTVFPGNGADQRISTHLSLINTSPDQKFRINAVVNYSVNFSNLINRDLTTEALTLAPVAPAIYNEDGTLNWEPTSSGKGSWTNPLAYLEGRYDATTNSFLGNVDASYRLLPDLVLKTSIGYTNTGMKGVRTAPKSMYDPYYTTYSYYSTFFQNNIQNWIIEPQLNYELHITNQQTLSVLAGATFMNQEQQSTNQSASGFPNEALMENIGSASTITTTSDFNQYYYRALFGRLNYTIKQRYIFNLTGRRDGSSRFGPGKQYANFGALGAAWIFSEEPFVKNHLSFLSFGKLRASYGTSGNDQIGNYQYLDTYSTTANNTYQGNSAMNPDRLFNADYAWEINKKFEVAVDLGFLKDRIFLQAGYYKNLSSSQLVSYALSPVTGFSSILSNLPATVQNTGVEIELNTTNFMLKNFKWETSFNVSIPRNKLVDFPNLESNSSYNSTLIIGEPLNIRKLYHYTGVDPQTGLYTFLDVDNSGTYNSTDRTIIKDFGRKFFGGLLNTFQYKGFQLDMMFQFVKQDGYNYVASGAPGMIIQNQPAIVLNRWKNPGDITDIQRYSKDSGDPWKAYMRMQDSDRVLTDASYIRLKNLSLTYTFSEENVRKLHLQGLSLYIQGQNLLTITNYQGLDPETGKTTLPPLRLITGGIRITL
ncbi:MAG: SusC/RagA family TonB-linked outer membrane protein, partial [Bacteroidales bacterium]|nr:SusC/RagA family TonB-linked outer membrane protein [Bacteroidales bacterium]